MPAPLYIVLWKEGKHYVSQCLNVDVSSFGDTKDDAVQNLHEALELYEMKVDTIDS
jgi:predicted RNase H-like HicB family nuclease